MGEAATAAVHISLNCSLLEEAKNETKMKSFWNGNRGRIGDCLFGNKQTADGDKS